MDGDPIPLSLCNNKHYNGIAQYCLQAYGVPFEAKNDSTPKPFVRFGDEQFVGLTGIVAFAIKQSGRKLESSKSCDWILNNMSGFVAGDLHKPDYDAMQGHLITECKGCQEDYELELGLSELVKKDHERKKEIIDRLKEPPKN